MTDDLTDDQTAIRDALVSGEADELVATITEDEQAVALEAGDAAGYFAPYEVREISMAVTKEFDGLPDPMKKALHHALIWADVVEGERTVEEAHDAADDDVEVTIPE